MNRQKIAATAMIPLVSGSQATDNLKAELTEMLITLDAPVGREYVEMVAGVVPVHKDFGIIKDKWCGHVGAHLTWADVDGDGKADMLCDDDMGRHWALLSNGLGGFKKDLGLFQTNWCGYEGARTYWADINGDGRADMLCSDKLGKHKGKLTGVGGPGTWLKDMFLDDKYCKGGDFKWVNINNDNKADMVCHYTGSGSFWSQLSNGDGTFNNIGDIELRFCHKDSVVNYADLNGDGNMDIICSTMAGYHHAVLLDDKGEQIPVEGADDSDEEPDLIATNFCAGHPDKVQFADINGDGFEDMLCDHGGNHWAQYSQGNGKFTDLGLWKGGYCGQDHANVNWVDITGDGIAEMICDDWKTGGHWAFHYHAKQ